MIGFRHPKQIIFTTAISPALAGVSGGNVLSGHHQTQLPTCTRQSDKDSIQPCTEIGSGLFISIYSKQYGVVQLVCVLQPCIGQHNAPLFALLLAAAVEDHIDLVTVALNLVFPDLYLMLLQPLAESRQPVSDPHDGLYD